MTCQSDRLNNNKFMHVAKLPYSQPNLSVPTAYPDLKIDRFFPHISQSYNIMKYVNAIVSVKHNFTPFERNKMNTTE